MSTKRILLIDDDIELAQLLSDYLGQEGYAVECCHDGLTGLTKSYDDGLDLILLDVMMPNLSGFEVLKALGGSHKTPILMLTAKGDDADRILGLELGADDYLAKPFHHRELLARIKAIFRRIEIVTQQKAPQQKLAVNGVVLDHGKREVFCHEQPVELTGTEYEMLHCLMEQHGTIVSKDALSEQVLGRKLSPFDRSIDMHVSNIRRKISQFDEQDKIKTIRGSGYLFLTGDS
ncbi:response regulator transcription factor [Thalassotalea atypica]|uniref:response regulator transcription factor n=1 Tax=Thalassotalea atypica TaxID=2054316 RepID=UPI002573618D|nr:response regulator transcription factor [Thalassotalea atypica]